MGGKGLRNTLRAGLVLSGIALFGAEKLAPPEFQPSTQINAIINFIQERKQKLDKVEEFIIAHPELVSTLKKLSAFAPPSLLLKELQAQHEINTLVAGNPELMLVIQEFESTLPSSVLEGLQALQEK